MKLVKSPNRWSCLPASFAMALDLPLNVILQDCGHDGSCIWWPELGEPECRRGFHIQEMIDLALLYNAAVIPFDAIPVSKGNIDAVERIVPMKKSSDKRMTHLLSEYNGVLTGETLDGQAHAIAWINGTVCDPGNHITSLEDFNIQTFWVVVEIKSS